MESTRVERVRGVNDCLGQEYQTDKWIQDELARLFELFGYQAVQVPVIEHTDLYLQKSGDQIAARLYEFTYQGRRLCLRPELTASILRAYLDHLRQVPLPVRLYSCGPVFRYEKPQKGTYRQFTQMGIELIGAFGSMADAEIVHLASHCLSSLGLSDSLVVLGHVGILSRFLQNLELGAGLRSFFSSRMELYRKYGREYIVKRLGEFDPGLALALSENWDDSPAGLPGEVHDRTLVQFFGSMDVSDAKSVLLELLKNLEMPLEGHRSEEEIVGRLLVKLMHRDQTSRVSQALTFMGELSQLTGEPASTLAEAEKLLRAYDVDSSPLRELRATIEALQYYEHDRPQIRIDFGLSRGLQYYTGIIFEIHHQGAGDEIQLCGGGRYDDLIGSLGGPEGVPAMGFSYGVERLRLTLEQQGRLPSAAKAGTDVLVAPLTSEDYAYSVMVGEFLRRAGLRVEVDFKERSMKSKLKYSAKRSIPFTISVGPDERATSTVHLKDMLARTENRLSLDAAQAYIVNSRSDVGRQ